MVSLVVPTFCERENMAPLLQRLAAVRDRLPEPLEVLIVDNRSEDGTASEAAQWMASLRLGRVIVCPHPGDLVHAVTEGIAAAGGELIGLMDADLSHPPEVVPALVAAVRGGALLALGSRYARGGGVANWPWSRRLLSRLGCLAAQPLLGVADGTSGFFLTTAAILRGGPLQSHGFKVLPEVLVRRCVHRVVEVPYVFTDRIRGRSKLRGRILLWYARQLLGLGWHRLTHPCRHPAAFTRESMVS
jgi:dolichol-phosphate mannosyltransferase